MAIFGVDKDKYKALFELTVYYCALSVYYKHREEFKDVEEYDIGETIMNILPKSQLNEFIGADEIVKQAAVMLLEKTREEKKRLSDYEQAADDAIRMMFEEGMDTSKKGEIVEKTVMKEIKKNAAKRKKK